MIFGYQLVDLILVDQESFLANYRYYLENSRLFVTLSWFGLLASFFMPKFSRSLVFANFSLGWAVFGYFFCIKIFSPIYWPAKYLGAACLLSSALSLWVAIQSLDRPLRLQQKNIITLLAVVGASLWFWQPIANPIAYGNSATLSALAILGVYLPELKAPKGISTAKTIKQGLCLWSIVWVLIVAIFSYGLASIG